MHSLDSQECCPYSRIGKRKTELWGDDFTRKLAERSPADLHEGLDQFVDCDVLPRKIMQRVALSWESRHNGMPRDPHAWGNSK